MQGRDSWPVRAFALSKRAVGEKPLSSISRHKSPLDPQVRRSWMHGNDGSRDAELTSQKPVTYVFLCRIEWFIEKSNSEHFLVYHKPEAVARWPLSGTGSHTHGIPRPLCGVACSPAPIFKAKPHGRYPGAAKGVFSFLPHSQAAWTRHLPVQAPSADPVTRCLSGSVWGERQMLLF